MSSDSLTGFHVLITRPTEQQQALRESIESHSGKALSLPLIEIQALQQADAIQAITDQIQQLGNYQILIFVSSNAAKFAGQLIADFWPQFPPGLSTIAVGPATAKTLSLLLDVDIIQPSGGVTSEDLLKLPLLNDVGGKKIAIVRAQGGRELLAGTLRARGAQVDYLEAYRRTPVDYDAAGFCERLKTAGVNVLTVTSSESLHRLQTMLADNKEQMSLLPLLVPSERIALQARELGFVKVVNANGADPENFLRALELLASSN